jgi:ribosome biogenesis GTPase / thiamine phosphate phosphatase
MLYRSPSARVRRRDKQVQNNLVSLGWSSHFSVQIREEESHLVPMRVSADYGAECEVLGPDGPQRAMLNRKLLYAAKEDELARPAVGDWVLAQLLEGSDQVRVVRVLTRASAVMRQAAGDRTQAQIVGSNLDALWIVSSMNREFHPRRLERYLVLARDAGVAPVIVLTKADAAADPATYVAQAVAVAGEAPVYAVSAVDGRGLDALGVELAAGRTVALVGSSGVGKSTLANWLMGEERMATHAIRDSDDEGRHTTTARHLLVLPGARGLLLDTPGIRELELREGSLEGAFADIEQLAPQCRFVDCGHEGEPGCAVRAAIEAGALDAKRLANYKKLGRELDYQARRQDERASMLEQQRIKRIHKERSRAVRKILRNKGY